MYIKLDANSKTEYTAKINAWMHHCYVLWTTGKVSDLRPSPFYERKDELTPAIVEAVVAHLEFLMKEELRKYPDYHRTAQGFTKDDPRTLTTVGWDKMPYHAQLALVQGIDQILQPYRLESPDVINEAIYEYYDYD